jgi:hypothetical protein
MHFSIGHSVAVPLGWRRPSSPSPTQRYFLPRIERPNHHLIEFLDGERLPSGTSTGFVATGRLALLIPGHDLRSEPQLDPTVAQIECRSRHVMVTVLVLNDCVRMAQTENLSNHSCIHEIVDIHIAAHSMSLHL